MKHRDTSRSGEALPKSAAEPEPDRSDGGSKPLDWIHTSSTHGDREISHYEVKIHLEDSKWMVWTGTVIWLTDRDSVEIEAEVRDPKIIEAVIDAFEIGHKIQRWEGRGSSHADQ